MTIVCSRCDGNHVRSECPTLGVQAMRMTSRYYELRRYRTHDILECRRTGRQLSLQPGELEELARFLMPLYEDVFIKVAKEQLMIDAHRAALREEKGQ